MLLQTVVPLSLGNCQPNPTGTLSEAALRRQQNQYVPFVIRWALKLIRSLCSKADARGTPNDKALNQNGEYRSAKPLFVGSIPTRASNKIKHLASYLDPSGPQSDPS
jgi:hypothetical protein